jgi:hypothetical protein
MTREDDIITERDITYPYNINSNAMVERFGKFYTDAIMML